MRQRLRVSRPLTALGGFFVSGRALRAGVPAHAAATVLVALLAAPAARAQTDPAPLSPDPFRIGRVKYKGGGDWYGDPTSLPNLLAQLRERVGMDVEPRDVRVEPGDESLYDTPFLYLTGHGKVVFDDQEAARLRRYLESGGFLYADDNYGMDEHFRKAMRRVLPEAEWVEVPFDHPIYHSYYDFPAGLPKIHEHYGGPPHGYALFDGGRMVVFYSYNTDIGDGLEDAEVHGDPPEKREAAMKMAVNVVLYAMTH